MIVSPEQMSFEDKTFSMIIYGSPGVGKSTLALSAPDPVLIDFDNGIARVHSYHRKATIKCATYEEVMKDIQSPAMSQFKTVIVDTGGSFVTYLQDWAMRVNPTINKQKNGAISLKGFGAVKQEFQRFTNFVRDTLHKNIIYVFHSQEQNDKDGNPQQRLLCEGAVKNIVWQPCDFGGYVQMIGDQRTIAFSPTQEYFAKGCFGIEGIRVVPNAGPTDDNNFITRLFDEARANIAHEKEFFAPKIENYERIMTEITAIVDAIDSPKAATQAAKDIQAMKHELTSLAESRSLLNNKVKALGYVWNNKAKAFEEVAK